MTKTDAPADAGVVEAIERLTADLANKPESYVTFAARVSDLRALLSHVARLEADVAADREVMKTALLVLANLSDRTVEAMHLNTRYDLVYATDGLRARLAAKGPTA